MVQAACIATLLIALAIDLLTPQLFIAAVLLDVPIVLASIVGNRRFTYGLVMAALAADALAGYANGVHAGYYFDPFAIGDRTLVAFSIISVGYLSVSGQEHWRRRGQALLLEQLAERNRELEQRNAVIRDLILALSHDLRTPLAALGMTMRQALSGAYGGLSGEYHEILRRSIVATDEVQRLAETLLLIARVETGDHKPQPSPFDLSELIRDISGELQALADTQRISLEVRTERPVVVVADRSDLRRAVTNLLANALQHAPEGGHVTVMAGSRNGRATVEVGDDGPGLSEPARARLFLPFAPGENARGAGTGLGLYLARRVALDAGGDISFAPQLPQGSLFSLWLPVPT